MAPWCLSCVIRWWKSDHWNKSYCKKGCQKCQEGNTLSVTSNCKFGFLLVAAIILIEVKDSFVSEMKVGLYFFTFHGQYQYCELFKCLQTHPSKNNPPLVRSVTKWDTQTLRGLSWKKCMHVCIKKLSDLYNYVLALSIKVNGQFILHIFRRRSHLHY